MSQVEETLCKVANSIISFQPLKCKIETINYYAAGFCFDGGV